MWIASKKGIVFLEPFPCEYPLYYYSPVTVLASPEEVLSVAIYYELDTEEFYQEYDIFYKAVQEKLCGLVKKIKG